jgi:hypothetical protein
MLLNTDKSNVQQLILGVNRHNKSTDLEHYPLVVPSKHGRSFDISSSAAGR